MPSPPRLRAWSSAVCTALGTWLASGLGSATAAPIDTTQLDGPLRSITYSTVADFGAYGPGWTPLAGLSFEGVQGRTVESAGPFRKDSYPDILPEGATAEFPLGRLVVELPAEGEASGGGAFRLQVRIGALDGVALDQPILVDMQADAQGTIRTDGESTLSYGVLGYSIHPPYTPPSAVAGSFQLDDLLHTVLVPDAAPGLVAFTEGREFSLDGRLISALAYNTPEPSTVLLFGAAGLLLAARRLRAQGRWAS